MPRLPPGSLRDRHDVTAADATTRSFWLDGSVWDYPDFENADTFVSRLLRKGVLVSDPRIEVTLHGCGDRARMRSAQRHFLRGTGLSHRAVLQIDRARRAALLLRDGVPIADVAHQCGYFDQAHLTHATNALIGLTPGEIARGTRQLSFLYKTPEPVTQEDEPRRLTRDRIVLASPAP